MDAYETSSNGRANTVSEFLIFLSSAQDELKSNLASVNDETVKLMRGPLEEHYLDDRGKPALYQRFESALYDGSSEMTTFWRFLARYDRQKLRSFYTLLEMEIEGLSTDRHPRKVFDRSPLGILAIVVGTITLWMTVVKNFTGEDLSGLLELIRFNFVAGAVWIGGLFVVLWFILKIYRNNRQLAFLGSLKRSLHLYLEDDIESGASLRASA